MPNPKYQEVRIPFEKMTFTPDVPSTALGANEYNDGLNVEADVRGIRSVAGDITILETVPGTPTYVSGGYRADNLFWFIVPILFQSGRTDADIKLTLSKKRIFKSEPLCP